MKFIIKNPRSTNYRPSNYTAPMVYKIRILRKNKIGAIFVTILQEHFRSLFFRITEKFCNFFLDKDMQIFFACDRVGNFELLLPNTNLISPPGGAILVAVKWSKMLVLYFDH